MTPARSRAIYTNPVYSRYFADPFVARFEDAYYAYGTGRIVDGRVFEVLISEDLVNWTPLGGAVEPGTDVHHQDWWAPEVVFEDGVFFMYYSVGVGDRGHRLRVAIADRPEGPFQEAGGVLTGDDGFMIDPHPFRDENGDWYLYYARDFLEGKRVGTALAVDRLKDMVTLEGEWQTVLRASADWQLFRRQRPMYGSIYDWYTIEGPFVRKHADTYYCFYSGGAWEEATYAVSYAVSDSPVGPFTDTVPDAPALLASVPGKVIGPGHISIVEGPDGEEYVAYHAWDARRTARRLCIDRLEWTPDGPRCPGPSFTPQPVPGRRRS